MKIELKKFGTMLVSRQAGREAYAAFAPSLREAGRAEPIEVDFSGVITFSPSWGDEFLRPLAENYGDRLELLESDNLSVLASLDILKKTNAVNLER
ncbi:MAG: DUF4325 domain-containing protein [Candidatus Vogelbacteria bacterium]|nr:DUF4325 domain-containing protein [Candidatus Vogelbacteria bacterium]